MKARRGAARRWLLTIVAVVVIAGVAFAFLRRSSGPQGARTAVERVTVGEFTRDVSGTGVVEAAQERTLTFGMSGTVAEIPVEEGARVEAGTVLARLDTAALERDLASNQASLASAQADARRLAAQQRVDELDTASGVDTAKSSLENAREALREAQTSLSTTQRLFDAGATSQSDLTAAQDAAAQAQRAVSQAEAALQTAESRNASFAQLSDAQTSSSEATIAGLETTIANLQENLGEATLTAPFAGVVSSIGFDVGDQVSAAGGRGSYAGGHLEPERQSRLRREPGFRTRRRPERLNYPRRRHQPLVRGGRAPREPRRRPRRQRRAGRGRP